MSLDSITASQLPGQPGQWVVVKPLSPEHQAYRHILQRIGERKIRVGDFKDMLSWVRSHPLAPTGEEGWYKSFGSFTLVGHDYNIGSVLEDGMHPKGVNLDKVLPPVTKQAAESSSEPPAWLYDQYKRQNIPKQHVPSAWEAIQNSRSQVAEQNLKIAKEKGFGITPDGDLVLYHGTRSGAAIRKSGFLRPGSYLSAIEADAKRYAQAAQKRNPAEVLRLEVYPGFGHLSYNGYFSAIEPIPVASATSKQAKAKFGLVEAPLSSNSSAHAAIQTVQREIDPADLAGKGLDIGALHVTIRYGVQSDDTSAIEAFLSEQAPFDVTLGATASFPPSSSSDSAAVIIAPAESEELHRLNAKLAEVGDFKTSDFATYNPHVTVAFVTPESADKYEGNETTAGKTFHVGAIVVSGPDKQKKVIVLNGTPVPKEAASVEEVNWKPILTEMMSILKPGLPTPEVKIINRKTNYLGQDVFSYGMKEGQTWGADNTTIEIQKSILADENTLRRVLAHELAHHEDNLLNDKPELLRVGFHTFRMMQRLDPSKGHGPKWREIAARFNARYGPDFVTPKSDASYVVAEDTTERKPFYVLMHRYVNGKLMWSQATRLTPKMLDKLKRRYEESQTQGGYKYRLFMTIDPMFEKSPKISDIGSAYPRDDAQTEKAERLWAEGEDILAQFAQGGKTAAPKKPYVPTVDNPAFKQWFQGSKVVDAQGNPMRVFRGDFRGDKLGPAFKKNRSTSGRFYFTEDPEIASNYSTEKTDAQHVEQNESVDNWFVFPQYKYKGERSAPNLRSVWYRLSPAEKQKVKDVLLNASLDDQDTIDFNAGDALNSQEGMADEARRFGGNWLMAGMDVWIHGGSFVDQEERFGELLDAMGLKHEFDSPHTARSAVTAVYLRITNPLDTAHVPQNVLDRLHQLAKSDRSRAKSDGYDQWDKTTTTVKEWVARLDEDIQNHTTYAWTTMPEKITQLLQSMGYDGIKDTGGKQGGTTHTVWIAFEPHQIKSATGNSGKFDPSKDSIVASKQAAPANDPTETPAFKAWFGNSKIVDEQGKPLKVYHGTDGEFDTFDTKPGLRGDGGIFEYTVHSPFKFFTPDARYAQGVASARGGTRRILSVYLKMESPLDLRTTSGLQAAHHIFGIFDDVDLDAQVQEKRSDLEDLQEQLNREETSVPKAHTQYVRYDESGDIVAVGITPKPGYVEQRISLEEAIEQREELIVEFKKEIQAAEAALQAALDQAVEGREQPTGVWDHFDSSDSAEKLKAAGYDGVIFHESDGTLTFAVPDSNQIKSVNNKGTFDPKSERITASKKASRPAIRRGEISPDGAYFSTPGSSTYYDEGAVETGDAGAYDLADANIADTTDPAVTQAILHETLKDESLTPEDRERVEGLLAEAHAGDSMIDYHANDELPIPAAAKRLGYDGILVWENDDWANPSSVFLWNVDKAQPKNASKQAKLPEVNVEWVRESLSKVYKELAGHTYSDEAVSIRFNEVFSPLVRVFVDQPQPEGVYLAKYLVRAWVDAASLGYGIGVHLAHGFGQVCFHFDPDREPNSYHNWKTFANKFVEFIAHETTHLNQFRAMRERKDTEGYYDAIERGYTRPEENYIKYLSHEKEIAAYARTAIEELHNADWSDRTILRSLRSNSLTPSLSVVSSSFNKYRRLRVSGDEGKRVYRRFVETMIRLISQNDDPISAEEHADDLEWENFGKESNPKAASFSVEAAAVRAISLQEVRDRKLFGPVYHGTTEEARKAIEQEGFKHFEDDAGKGGSRNGYEAREYAQGVPPPVHHLGYGTYFTTVKAIGKMYNENSTKGLVEYYIDAPRMETINFAAPNTMMKWWVANGYDPAVAKTDRVKATKLLTETLKSKYDAVWFKGKTLRKALDGDQVVVFDPDRVYKVDKTLSKPGEEGTPVIRKSDGMKGTIVRVQPLAEQFRHFHEGADRLITVKWQKGGTDSKVKPNEIEYLEPKKKAKLLTAAPIEPEIVPNVPEEDEDDLPLEDALDDAAGNKDELLRILTKHKARKAFDYPGGWIMTIGKRNPTVVKITKDFQPTVWNDAYSFVSESDLDQYFPPEDDDRFNKEFWKSPSDLYHATDSGNLESILKDGLSPRNKTRGMSNRSTGASVFTSTNSDELDSYGDALLRIDTEAMSRDIPADELPYAEREPDVVEGERRESLAHRVGLESYSYDYEYGMSPDTIILNGYVPPQYLHVERGDLPDGSEGGPEPSKRAKLLTGAAEAPAYKIPKAQYLATHQECRVDSSLQTKLNAATEDLEPIGVVGDFLIGEPLRKLFSEVLNVPVRALREPVQQGRYVKMQDWQWHGGWGSVDGKPTIFINPDTDRAISTFFEEAAHGVRASKGRNMEGYSPLDVLTPEEYESDPAEISAKKFVQHALSLLSNSPKYLHMRSVLDAVRNGKEPYKGWEKDYPGIKGYMDREAEIQAVEAEEKQQSVKAKLLTADLADQDNASLDWSERREKEFLSEWLKSVSRKGKPGIDKRFQYSLGGGIWCYRDEAGKPIAFVEFQPDGVYHMGVLRPWRRRGIITKLLDELAKDKGITELKGPYTSMGRAVADKRNNKQAAPTENKIEGMMKSYGLTREQVDEAITIDPSPNQTDFVSWICKQVKAKTIRLPEDANKIKNQLKTFLKLKRSPTFKGEKDIQRYTPASLYEVVQENSEAVSNKQQTRDLKAEGKPGAAIIYNQDGITVYKVTDVKALNELSSNTNWCTAQEEYATEYLSKGPNYVVYFEGKPFAQWDPDSNQLMDVNDNDFRETWGSRDEVVINEIMIEVIQALPAIFKGIATHVVTLTEGLRNAASAYEYAHRILGDERFPQGESLIAQDAVYSLSYAETVLKGPFPQGEPAIAKNADLAYKYAVRVLHGRFPAAEDLIMRSNSAVDYAADVIKGRWPEAEPFIAGKEPGSIRPTLLPYTAYRYALKVVKGRWPEGEDLLASTAETAFNYAKTILHDRFPEGEPLIRESKRTPLHNYAEEYAWMFLPYRKWPDQEQPKKSKLLQKDAAAPALAV